MYYYVLEFIMENMFSWLDEQIDANLIPTIADFVRIPNQSRQYDQEWDTNGLQQKACNFCIDWANKLDIEGLTLELIEEEGKTPVVLGILDSPNKSTVLMYGHIDKQPPLTEAWNEDLHPYKPVIKNNKLYGRGAADDGYAFFSSLLMVKALQKFGFPHNRIVFFFETDEESGSRDLLYYLEKMKPQIGEPSLVICLDSGCCDYENMCITTTLRGNMLFRVKAQVCNEGLHSGDASGIVPDSFRILRDIMEGFEDRKNGRLISDLYVNIPPDKYKQAYEFIQAVGGKLEKNFPFTGDCKPVETDGFKQYMNRIWQPTLTLTGIDGVPHMNVAGNVLRPYTTLHYSLRLPPTLNRNDAIKYVENYFKNVEPLCGAQISFELVRAGQGFSCPEYKADIESVINEASHRFFGKKPLYFGEGGSIPFINELTVKFPNAQFIVTGVLGPESNAHGPNEFLHLPYLKKIVLSLTSILQGYNNCKA